MRLHILSFCALMIMARVVAPAQSVIQLVNPSFEDLARHSHTPRGWYDCGFPGESPPDVQPDPTFQVSKTAYDGDTYLGMVVRDNDTWEAVSQKLSTSLVKGKCYEFSIFLARSESYISVSRMTEEQANYITPAKLRIWGGFDYCDKQYLLGETKLVISTRWLEYKFKFEPIGNYTHIVIQAFYNTPTLFPYNGNILIDKASDIKEIPCDKPIVEVADPAEKPVPKVAEKAPPKTDTTKPKNPTASLGTKPKATPDKKPDETKPVLENVKISELKSTDLKEGQTIRIDNLYFEADKAIITQNSFSVLDDIYTFLSKNAAVSIEIGGHTNGLPSDEYCDKLSNDRAKAVYDYLLKKGIEKMRVQYKGYGKRQRIASDATLEGRRKNQRVEIKILSLNG